MVVGKMPEFIGGTEALMKYLKTNAIYTKQAIKDSIEGNVFISFWVTKNGTISNPVILRGLNHDLDSISLNLIKNMPKWLPATQRDLPIAVKYTIPIKFSLNRKSDYSKPTPTKYWLKKGKREFYKLCKKQFGKDQNDCDCWYNFIIWNYNSCRIDDLDLKEMFEKQKCDKI